MEGAHRLVNQLVRLDRLPPCNSLEGLLLLQDAWRDFDVAMLLAGRYKRLCKAIFAAQLFFSWLVVVGSGGGDELLEPTLSQDAGGGQWPIEDIVFALSVAVSIMVSLEAVLHSKARWRQLRSGACALQSTIWRYRSRTGPFEVEESRRDSTRPEHMLCTVLNQWRTNLMAGASLKTTNLKRQHPKHVYTHFQYSGTPGPNADDHQSPTQPVRYIALRIDPMMAFYAKRIPFYTRQGLLLKTAIILFSVVASVLARYGQLTWVTAVTALATVVTSWSEFSDCERKVERYSSAISGLEALLSWWRSLGEVQKASKESISHLVNTAESIIAEKQFSWTSTAGMQDQDANGRASSGAGGKDEKARTSTAGVADVI